MGTKIPPEESHDSLDNFPTPLWAMRALLATPLAESVLEPSANREDTVKPCQLLIVALNGPPGSGKDLLANILMEHSTSYVQFHHTKITDALSLGLKHLFQIPDDEYQILRELRKDSPCSIFGGRSFREMMIFLSEKFMKPEFGKDIWISVWWRGIKQLLKNVSTTQPTPFTNVIIVSDLGFQNELEEMRINVGKENILVCQFSRPNRTFSFDSRGPVSMKGIECMQIDNNGSIENLKEKAKKIIQWVEINQSIE